MIAAGMRCCRVCRDGPVVDFAILDHRRYERCSRCLATLVAVEDLPEPDAERHHYLRHENDVDDPGYRRFASRLVEPLAARLSSGAHGLDYGCGTGPVAAAMLGERGLAVELFDPFFAPNEAVLERTYDFVFCSEVIEHFHGPAEEFDRLAGLLDKDGLLAVMTCFQTDDERFATWHYRRDSTHVAFYREETLRCVAGQRGWTCEFPARNVAIFRAP
jgi:SAM-dependent methyltransferase